MLPEIAAAPALLSPGAQPEGAVLLYAEVCRRGKGVRAAPREPSQFVGDPCGSTAICFLFRATNHLSSQGKFGLFS